MLMSILQPNINYFLILQPPNMAAEFGPGQILETKSETASYFP